MLWFDLLAATSIVASNPLSMAACELGQRRATIFRDGPPAALVAGTVVAEMEFPPELSAADFLRSGGVARFVHFFRGTFAGATILVSPGSRPDTCADPFARGRRGVVVARFAIVSGRPTLEPLWTSGEEDPDGAAAGEGTQTHASPDPFQSALMMWVTCEGPRSQEMLRRLGRAGPGRVPDLSDLPSCDQHHAKLEEVIQSLAQGPARDEAQALVRGYREGIAAAARDTFDRNNYE